MIVIIDYQVGNLGSIYKALKFLKIPVKLTGDYQEIKNAAGIILPGVGAFGEGMRNLQHLQLADLVISEARKGKPFLGICLGMQLLFSSSEEDGITEGLNLFKGRVRRFNPERVGKIPHIGWNQIETVRDDPLFKDSEKENFYFVHGYYVDPLENDIILGKTVYGNQEFVSVVQKDKIWGVQCHPEKSSRMGLRVLQNFSEVVYSGGYSGR